MQVVAKCVERVPLASGVRFRRLRPLTTIILLLIVVSDLTRCVKRNEELEATIVAKFCVMAPVLDERARRLWAAAESVAIGYGGDALVSAATGLASETIRHGRRELTDGVEPTTRIRRVGAGRPALHHRQPGLKAA